LLKLCIWAIKMCYSRCLESCHKLLTGLCCPANAHLSPHTFESPRTCPFSFLKSLPPTHQHTSHPYKQMCTSACAHTLKQTHIHTLQTHSNTHTHTPHTLKQTHIHTHKQGKTETNIRDGVEERIERKRQ